MKAIFTTLSKKAVLLALGASLIGAPALAFADSNKGSRPSEDKLRGNGVEVVLNTNGSALVRGAKVTAVSGSTITASTVWGATTVSWTVKTGSSTQFVKSPEGRGDISTVVVGDSISFNGTLDTTASSLTVNAKSVKDWTNPTTPRPTSSSKVQGVVTAFNASLKSITLAVAGIGSISVETGSTTVFKENGTTVDFNAVTVGDTLRAEGSYTVASSTFAATSVALSSVGIGNHNSSWFSFPKAFGFFKEKGKEKGKEKHDNDD